MKKDIDVDAVFFDLFYTLVTPSYNASKNENEVLGFTIEEWESYVEDEELYIKRSTGQEKDPKKIIESIIEKFKIDAAEGQIEEILNLRKERFKNILTNVDRTILETISDLKKAGKKICLVSNADTIDVMYWDKSPLCKLFDDTIFSYEVGYLKPQTEIYELALKRMNAKPEKSVFIGDGGSDEMKGAKQMGINTILTSYLLKRDKVQHDDISKFADYYVEDFRDILKLF